MANSNTNTTTAREDSYVETLSHGMSKSERSLRAVLEALNRGMAVEATGEFNESFTFSDNALGLEFNDKAQLLNFFQRSRELFPDALLEIESTYAGSDHAVAEWKLTATRIEPCAGYCNIQVQVCTQGVSIAHIRDGWIVKWADYYEAASAWRFGLAESFNFLS